MRQNSNTKEIASKPRRHIEPAAPPRNRHAPQPQNLTQPNRSSTIVKATDAMEALIQKRIRTKEPFAWENQVLRYDTGISSTGGADDTGAVTSTSAPATTSVDDLMRYVTFKAAEQVGIPASERWARSSLEEKNNASATNPSKAKEAGAGNATSSTSTASPTKPTLFEAILNLFAADPNEELYVKDVVEKTMDAVNPADVPPELSSTHLILVTLSFLSTAIPGLDDRAMANEGDEDEGMTLLRNTFPSLPLLENVSGFSTKITWRKYKLASSDWKGLSNDEGLRRKVHNLEAAFNMSTVAYQTRYCLTPRLSSTEEEKEVLRTGFVPATMDVSAGATPSSSRPNTPTPTAKKKKKDAQSASTASTSSSSAVVSAPASAPAPAATPAKESKVDAPSSSTTSGAPALAPPKPSVPPSTGKRKASSDQDNSSPTEPPTKKAAKTAANANGQEKCKDDNAAPAIASGNKESEKPTGAGSSDNKDF